MAKRRFESLGNNTRLRQVLGWEPSVTLEAGLAETYAWIEKQLAAR